MRGSAEDVFNLLEEGRVALSGAVFDVQGRAELLEKLPLFAGQFAGRNHAHGNVEIASATALRISQAFALLAMSRPGLGALGALQPFFAAHTRHHDLRPEPRHRAAERNLA